MIEAHDQPALSCGATVTATPETLCVRPSREASTLGCEFRRESAPTNVFERQGREPEWLPALNQCMV